MITIIEAHQNEIHPELLALTRELRWDGDSEKGVRVLRTVLHTLRDLLRLDDAIALLMLLPHPMKGVFVENWSTADLPSVSPEASDFLVLVRQKAGKLAFLDFSDPSETEQSVRYILGYISERLDTDRHSELLRYLPPLVRPYARAYAF
ncbi:MAG: DUF2267 domain-containing protein [Cytophagales bacterium]|jgi:uncharacterized protein (DUF2267 family)|nr:DUF2267 domain-containing protein [Cytophagales bacterium]